MDRSFGKNAKEKSRRHGEAAPSFRRDRHPGPCEGRRLGAKEKMGYRDDTASIIIKKLRPTNDKSMELEILSFILFSLVLL